MNHSFNSHRIRCISIIGGFLDGTKFELADGLNCFIGYAYGEIRMRTPKYTLAG